MSLAGSETLCQFALIDKNSEDSNNSIGNRNSVLIRNSTKARSITENFDRNSITIQESIEPFVKSTRKRWVFRWKVRVLILSIRKTAIRIRPARI